MAETVPSVAEEGNKIPIYFYWDNATFEWEFDLAGYWNFVFDPPDTYKGQTFSSCDDLEQLLDGRPFDLDVAREVGSLICPSASVLGHLSRPTTVVFEDPVKLDKDIYENLDVSGLSWNLPKVAKRQGPFTLAQLKTKHGLYKNQVWVDVGEWSFRIDIQAMADFDGDGIQDVYGELWQEKLVPHGQIVSYPLLLSRTKKGGPIIAKPVYIRKPLYFKPSEDLKRDMVIMDPRYDE